MKILFGVAGLVAAPLAGAVGVILWRTTETPSMADAMVAMVYLCVGFILALTGAALLIETLQRRTSLTIAGVDRDAPGTAGAEPGCPQPR
jgi:hypothetical protein